MGRAMMVGLVLLVLAGVAVLMDLVGDAGKFRRLAHATPVKVMVCETTEQRQTSGIVFLDGEQLKFISDDADELYEGATCQVRFGE